MSTRSYIGIKESDDKVKYIYCHHDGYPEGVGKTLKDHYTNNNIVNDLINSGDHSCLGEKPNVDSYESLGEDYEDVKCRYTTFENWKNLPGNCGVDYLYLYYNDQWHVWSWDKDYNGETY